jgi:hypothetical protein
MDRREAISVATSWARIRDEVRKELVQAAREANPVPDGKPYPNNEVRKLYQYPGDLSEQRLLKLIGVLV